MARSILLASLLFGLAGVAHADSAILAREHYQKGTTLYDLGKFHDAALEYEEAYKAKSDPALLFNIGQAYRLAGEHPPALRSYKSFLRKLPDAPNRRDVEAQIARLQKIVDEEASAAVSPPTGTLQPSPAAPMNPTNPTTTTTVAAAPVLVASEPAPKPVYKKWWLWTAVGGAVVVGVAVGLAVAFTTPADAPSPPNTFGVHLH